MEICTLVSLSESEELMLESEAALSFLRLDINLNREDAGSFLQCKSGFGIGGESMVKGA